jgi:hypothetical protein
MDSLLTLTYNPRKLGNCLPGVKPNKNDKEVLNVAVQEDIASQVFPSLCYHLCIPRNLGRK